MGGWVFPLGTKVAHDGTVTMFGLRRYWSADAMALRGLWVSATEELDRCELIIEHAGREYVLKLIDDLTRRNPETEAIARELIIRRQISELLDVLDQRIERALQRAQAGDRAAGHNRISNFLRLLHRAWKFAIQDREVRLDEAAQGIDLDLQKIEAILKHGKAFGFGHGVSPVGFENPTAAAEAAHRLSENRK